MDIYKKERTKYDVPVDHLDYGYIEKCQDVKELEKILKVLRSGAEGTFPQLEHETEEKIRQLNPKSRALLKDQPIFSTFQLGKEGSALADDFARWTDDMTQTETAIQKAAGSEGLAESSPSFPPVRGTANIQLKQQGATVVKDGTRKARNPLPRSQKEWDKIDVDAELRRLEEEEEQQSGTKKPDPAPKNVLRRPGHPNIPERVDCTGLTDDEKRYKAEKEKGKGNEAFCSHDYLEAVLYYTRSLSLVNTTAATNNRAQAYVKLEKWDEAIRDCSAVLQQEPQNLKAYLRRSVARKGKRQFKEAKKDLDVILGFEPNNKRAKELLGEVEKALEEQKVKGRRMVIEEVSESESEEEGESEGEEGEREGEMEGEATQQKVTPQPESETSQPVPEPVTSQKEQVTSQQEPVTSQSEPEPVTSQTQSVTSQPESLTSQTEPVTSQAETPEATQEQSAETPRTEEQVAAPAPPQPLAPGLAALREEGNQLFRTGHYADAVIKYSAVIDRLEKDAAQAENLALLYCNRAACRIKTGDCSGCVEDCDRSLVLSPHSVKALLRRAMANEAMERYRPAYVDYRHVLNVDPTVDIAQQGAARCQQTLQAQDGPKWRDKLPPIPAVSRASLPPQPPVKVVPSAAPQKVVPKKVVPEEVVREKVVPEKSEAERAAEKEALYEQYKTEGNNLVKKGEFSRAIELYTRCVATDPSLTASYTNRALCYLRLNKPSDALCDCDSAVQREPGNVKALFRRGQANKMLGDHTSAARDLELVLTLDPSNAAARLELQVVNNYIAQEKAKQQHETSGKSSGHSSDAAPGRRKVQIEEVEGSSSEDEAEPVQTGQKPAQTGQEPNQTSGKEQNSPVTKPNQTSEKPDLTGHKENRAPITPDQSIESSSTAEPTQSADRKSSKKGTSETKNTTNSGTKTDSVKKESQAQKAKKAENSALNTAASDTTEPTLTAVTPYNFLSAWKALKHGPSTERYTALLRQLTPAQLPAVLSNKLEGDMLQRLVQCTDLLAQQGDPRLAYDYLQQLSTVPRFQMNTMFMSHAEKQEVRAALERLKDVATPQELGALLRSYGV